jgi:hypothetical protein
LGRVKEALKLFKKALAIDKDYDIAKISKDLAQDLLKSIKKEKNLKTP